jgi:hypothetical protein
MTPFTDLDLNSGLTGAYLTQQVEALLAQLTPAVTQERRREERVAIPVLLRITPLDPDRQSLLEEATIVVGKNISRRGISFYHERPLLYRRAIIELAEKSLGSFSAEIDVKWCRFTRPGWYESGGRLIRLATGNVDRLY